jgi:type IV secretory pathway TrbD component
MLSTLFLLLLVAFMLGYLTSDQVKMQPVGYQVYVTSNPRIARIMGGILLAVPALALGLQLGWMTGLSIWLVGLMCAGCLVVTLAPFGYLTGLSVAALYAVFLGLELLF